MGQHRRRGAAGAPEARRHRPCDDDTAGHGLGGQEVRQVHRRWQSLAGPGDDDPYAWYQYFINTADADVVNYLRWFTFLEAGELAELEEATRERPHQRTAQRRLAAELTTLVHGEAATRSVEHASQALFGRGELSALDEPTLAAALRRHRWPNSPRADRI